MGKEKKTKKDKKDKKESKEKEELQELKMKEINSFVVENAGLPDYNEAEEEEEEEEGEEEIKVVSDPVAVAATLYARGEMNEIEFANALQLNGMHSVLNQKEEEEEENEEKDSFLGYVVPSSTVDTWHEEEEDEEDDEEVDEEVEEEVVVVDEVLCVEEDVDMLQAEEEEEDTMEGASMDQSFCPSLAEPSTPGIHTYSDEEQDESNIYLQNYQDEEEEEWMPSSPKLATALPPMPIEYDDEPFQPQEE